MNFVKMGQKAMKKGRTKEERDAIFCKLFIKNLKKMKGKELAHCLSESAFVKDEKCFKICFKFKDC